MDIDEVRNTIIVGRAEDVLPTFPERSIPLFVFSPPYNLNRRADGRLNAECCPAGGITRSKTGHYADGANMSARGGQGKWKNGVAYDGTDDAMPWPEYVVWQHAVLRACWRALSDDGAIFYVHKPRVQNGECITPLEYNPGLPLRQIIIWARAGGVNMTLTHFMPTHEWIVVLAKPEFRLRSKGISGAYGDVWYVPQESGTWHPAPFPDEIPLRILDATAAPLVCDPFMGSGTTGKAARRMGRDYIGIEQSAAYAARARREIAAVEGRDLGGELTPLELWAAREDAA